MDRILSITDTASAQATAPHAPGICWCGQALEHVRGNHCPRCGRARAARVEAPLSRLAA